MILRDVEYTTRHFIVINVERNQLRGIVVDDIGPDALEFYDHELPLEVAREHYKPYEKS